MARASAGLLLYRVRAGALEVLLVHPGGPYWTRKDLGAWSVPKGLIGDGEDPLAAARREFEEETGAAVEGPFHSLGGRKQPGGKVVHVWAVEGNLDAAAVRSNTFSMEWPPGTGRRESFPEIDRAEWFVLPEARRRILQGLSGFLDDLESILRTRSRV